MGEDTLARLHAEQHGGVAWRTWIQYPGLEADVEPTGGHPVDPLEGGTAAIEKRVAWKAEVHADLRVVEGAVRRVEGGRAGRLSPQIACGGKCGAGEYWPESSEQSFH